MRNGRHFTWLHNHNSRSFFGGKEWIVIKNGTTLVDTGKKVDYWQWQGSLDGDGYGNCYSPTHLGEQRASRFTYKKFIGPIPKGMTVDHLGNHKDDVNPYTVELVSTKENTVRRSVRNAHKSKFTSLQISCIVSLCATGMSYSAIGKQFNVDPATIRKICLCKIYKHIKRLPVCSCQS